MTQMRVGNQTAFIANPFEPFDYAKENGFDAFEWFPDKKESGAGWLVTDIDQDTREYIKNTAQEHNIVLSVHASTVSHPYSQEGWEMFWRDIDFAEHINASVFNIHFDKEQGIETFADKLLPVIHHLGERGIKLAIENTPPISPHDFNGLFGILRHKGELLQNNIGICLDLGHANICEATRNNYIKYVDEIDRSVPIIHMHVHENYGDYDSHLPLFTGPSGQNDAGIRILVKRLKQRSFHGSLILEQWPDPHSLLNQARDRLLWIINDVKVKVKDSQKVKPASATGGKYPVKVVDKPVKKEKEPEKTSSSLEIPAPLTNRPSGEPVNRVRKHDHSVTSDEFVKSIMHIDETCQSWREKLNGICQLFEGDDVNLTSEQLVYIAVYLRFLGTGEILCVEDGRHFRPSHHARKSQEIQQRLAALATADNALVIRKIYPWLPSYDSAFMRAEPLTRIRDIAHRNDIPKDLKNEIKHRLQNKLHRCAGPEDLITSDSILRRISAPGAHYSPLFVEQFIIFHKELKEFFSAQSLDEWLVLLIHSENVPLSDLASRFFKAKKKTEEKLDHYAVLLTLLTELRNLIHQSLAGTSADAGTQKLRLTDIGLEDYAFVLLSKMINKLGSSKQGVHWKMALYSLALTVENLRLSGVSHEECQAVERALHQWYEKFTPSDRTQLLIVKATLDRCRLLSEEYSNHVINLFFDKVDILGRSLGIPEHAVRVYCESDIRGNIVFQMSKLVSWLLKKIRQQADLPPWDVIVPGTAQGNLVISDSLPELTALHQPGIVLLRRAEGDEEIPKEVKSLVLCHELPHLSHLAVRARQEGVVLITGEDKTLIHFLEEHGGKTLTIEAAGDGVSFKTDSQDSYYEKEKEQHKTVSIPDVDLSIEQRIRGLSDITINCSGGKAYGTRKLYELSSQKDLGFKVPQSVALPFSVMEQALERIEHIKAEYEEHARALSDKDNCNEKNLNPMSELIEDLPFDNEIIKIVENIFPNNEPLMVRSSASCEDLEELAGAGLYTSVANVMPHDIEKAVKTVWASLWSRRAVLSRIYSNVPHDMVYMGVLIQEMIRPEYSFIIHTVNPISGNSYECYCELAVGLGETLASGAMRGVPYRMVCNKETGEVTMLAFASFSYALWPDQEKGTSKTIVDYSRAALSCDEQARNNLGKRLAQVSRFVESALGQPQDIEGVVTADNEIYLVQTRTQQGIVGKQ